LPNRALCVGYAFVYDLTKMLQGLPDWTLYLLFHEEKRARIVKGKVVYKPVHWGEYKLNYMNRKLTVSRGNRAITVWDIFRFFATKFTGALLDWKIAAKEKLERMESMKAQRSRFDQLAKGEIHDYCKEECAYLSRLGRRLIDAHDQAGLPLKNFYGAGSTASSFLTRIDIKSKRGEIPERMRLAIASAFFGGRFENSRVGPIGGPVYDYDISSAYPYHATLLPCLQHGYWRFASDTRPIAAATLALVHWTIPVSPGNAYAWGPLPVRSKDGTIAFPLSAKGGWCWKKEFLTAQRTYPNVEATEAWIYETECDCKPFADIPQYYRERIRLGKDAEGLVIKLGLNSIYGKLAQSKGLNPPYQSWVWAGSITSGCRAQLLDAYTRTASGWNTLMLATDGVWTTERLGLPLPLATGTNDLSKPLGGWEEKVFDRGVFCVRPGIYFPLEPTEEEIEKVRARGLGRRLLYEQWEKIVDAWEHKKKSVKLTGVQRFIGAKTGFSFGKKSGLRRSRNLGEWIDHPIEVSFNPKPKRARILRDNRLEPHDYFDYESVPYDNALLSEDAKLLQIAEMMAEEQPNADFADPHLGLMGV
jgi:hypothetical protein